MKTIANKRNSRFNTLMIWLTQKLPRFSRKPKQRVFIFGTGRVGQATYRSIKSASHVLGFIDNDRKKQGNKLYGKTIYSPERLYTRDYTQIVIASMYSGEIMVQLVKTLNVPAEKINVSSAHLQERPGLLKHLCPASLEYSIRKNRDPDFRRACYAAECYEKRPLRPNHILYEPESFANERSDYPPKKTPDTKVRPVLAQNSGANCCTDSECAFNPYSLFQSLLKNPDYQEMVHVLAINNTKRNQTGFLRAHPRVRIVEIDSDKYIEYAQTCKYCVTQRSLKPYIAKRKGQIFVTTWSDTLHKRTDHDTGRPWETKDTARSLALSDYFVGPDEESARQLIRSLRIDRMFQGKLIVPRHAGGDIGQVCRSLADLIFKGIESEDIIPYSDDGMERVNILMYPGALHPNGVTTGFIALLNKMDHEHYAVTVLLPNDDVGRDYQRLIHPKVNVLFNTMIFGYTRSEFRKKMTLERRGLRHQRQAPTKAFRRNMRRALPDLVFDVAIDYHGYSPEPAAALCFGVEAKKRVIYMHNNLYQDMLIKQPQLHAVFSLYKYFDRIMCESAESLHQNIEGAGAYIKKRFGYEISHQMDFTHNLIDPDAITERAREKPVFHRGETLMYRVENTINAGQDDRYTFEIPAPLVHGVNFITIGRLSPEKNHLRMLKALRLLVDTHSNVRLYLVGQGALQDELERAGTRYGLEKHVVFVYHMSNPFPLLDLCDCFLLSSDIEGQAVTVLEALALGKLVISTDIPGTRSMLKDGQGILVPPDAEAMAKAMIAFVESPGDVGIRRFDAAEYVRNAMRMYEQKVFKLSL